MHTARSKTLVKFYELTYSQRGKKTVSCNEWLIMTRVVQDGFCWTVTKNLRLGAHTALNHNHIIFLYSNLTTFTLNFRFKTRLHERPITQATQRVLSANQAIVESVVQASGAAAQQLITARHKR